MKELEKDLEICESATRETLVKWFIPSESYYYMLKELSENLLFDQFLKAKEIIEKHRWPCM